MKTRCSFACLLIAIMASAALAPCASAGVGARHFMEGAVFAKYLTKQPAESTGSRIQTYASAFLVGMISHGISDHFGNYEPHSDQPEYYYFIGEGLLGCALLYPEWRKDPRLFFGSMGGAFPDIDQMEPFGRKVYPTHSGEIPHYRMESFWKGAILNLAINGAAYYAIRHDLFPDDEYRSRFSVGYSIGFWSNSGAQSRDIGKWPSGRTGSPHRQIHILYDLSEQWTASLCSADWMRDVGGEWDRDYPPRVNLDGYSLSFEMHALQNRVFRPYIAAGAGIVHASISGAVDRGDISFSSHAATSPAFEAGGGVKISLNRSMRITLDRRYHDVSFRKSLDGKKRYSGWSTGIGIEHRL